VSAPEGPREIARRVLVAEAQAITGLLPRLDATFDRAVEAVASCSGRVVLLGVGKSGLVCRKIAATLSSTGSPAIFVHPAEAIHGDLGGVVPGDAVIVASASGETEELVRLVPLLRQVASTLIALCGRRDSTLARAADIVLDVSIEEEGCPLGLAPAASSTATLAMGDALALAVAARKGFTAEDFGRLHPGGSLGRRFQLVRDLMKTGADVPVVGPGAPLREVIQEISAKRLGMTTVQSEGRLVGAISDGDLRRLLERSENPLAARAEDIMSRGPRTVPADLPAQRAIDLMEGPPRRVMWLVVTDAEGAVSGVLHLHDVLSPAR
jgi:arabinose-5-phosphate isomerase